MPLFVWKPSYELKMPEIDVQHRRLVEMINELYEAMKDARGQEVLDRILSDLREYICSHFDVEERIMKQCRYPGYEEHVGEHRALAAEVTHLYELRRHGGAVSTPELMSFLCNWLREHMAGSDKEFGLFVKQARPSKWTGDEAR